MIKNLPLGWTIKKLGGKDGIGTIVTGNTPPRAEMENYGGSIPWVKPEDLDKEMYIYASKEYLSEIGVKKARLLPSNSILISCIGNIGKMGIAKSELTTNQQINSVVLGTGYDPEYVYFALKNILPNLKNINTSLVAILNASSLGKIEIPIPPTIEEQEKIADEISKKMENASKMREAGRKQEEAVNSLQDSMLREVFPFKEGDKLPDGWKWTNLGSIMTMKNGINFNEAQKGSGVLTVDVFNMYSDSLWLNTDNLYRVDTKLNNNDLLEQGDILFVRSSVKKEGVGYPSIFVGLGEPVTYCGFLINGKLNDKKNVLPEYICLYLRQACVRNKVISSAGQTTITNINQGALQSIKIALPEDVSVQKALIEKIRDKVLKQGKIKTTFLSQNEAIKAVPSAILKQAFAFA